MVDVSEADETSNGYLGRPTRHQPEPEWRCAKFLCSEGGLLAFEEWNEQKILGGITPDFVQPNDRDIVRGLTPDCTLIGKNTPENQDFGKYKGDRGITRGDTLQSALIGKDTTQNQWFEASDQGDQGNQGTTPLKNEGVGDVPSEQDTPPKKRGEELPNTLIAPIASSQTQTQQGNQGVIRADQSTLITPDHPDHPDHPNRLLTIDEWVSQLSQVANRDGTTYEAVKELGVPNHLRPEIFTQLTVQVKERFKGLREEFERRIPQDIEKWRKAIATWPALDANALNAQWQQFDLWSQCLLGIGNWAERIEKSGLFSLGASVYTQALELASEKSEAIVDSEVTNAELTPKQLNLLPDVQSPPAPDNRFAPECEDWF